MGWLRLFKQAMEEGCGIPFSEVRKDKRLHELINNEIRFNERYPEDSAERFVHSMSSHEITREKNLLYQRVPQEQFPPFTTRVEYSLGSQIQRGAMRYLGEKLAKAAEAQLPDRAIELAAEYKSQSTYEERFYTIRKFSKLMAELTMEANDEKASNIFNWVDEAVKDYDYRGCLPIQYGKIGQGGHPVCLGMAQLLVAWGRLTGARMMLTNLLSYTPEYRWKVDGEISKLLLDDIRRRKLCVISAVIDDLKNNIAKAKAYEKHVVDFHPAIAIEAEEGIWFYTDPYCLYFATFPPTPWLVTLAYLLLNGFDEKENIADADPGLTIAGSDGGFLVDWCKTRRNEASRALHNSQELEKKIVHVKTRKDFFESFEKFEELKYLASLTRKIGRSSRPNHLIAKLMLGRGANTKLSRKRASRLWAKYEQDLKFRRLCHRRLLALFHIYAKKVFYHEVDELIRHCRDIPPYLEFCNPEFTLALQTMNNLSCWGPNCEDLGLFFVKHSTSQVFWHEAMANGLDIKQLPEDRRWIMEQATDLVKFLDPRLHPLVKMKLKNKNRRKGGKRK